MKNGTARFKYRWFGKDQKAWIHIKQFRTKTEAQSYAREVRGMQRARVMKEGQTAFKWVVYVREQ